MNYISGARSLLTLQFRTSEILDNIFPVGGVVETAQVRLELSTKNLQSSTLADTVGSDETKNLSGAGHRKPVQLEAVGAISVGNLAFEVGGKVDDGNGIEWALLGADTATNTERLGDEGEAGFGRNFNAELATSDDWAGFLAFLATLSGATLSTKKVCQNFVVDSW